MVGVFAINHVGWHRGVTGLNRVNMKAEQRMMGLITEENTVLLVTNVDPVKGYQYQVIERMLYRVKQV